MAKKQKFSQIAIAVVIAVVIIFIALAFFRAPAPMPEEEFEPMPLEEEMPEPEVDIIPAEEEQIIMPEPPPTVIEPQPAVGNPQFKIISFVIRPQFPSSGQMVTFKFSVKNVGDKSPETTADIFVNNQLVSTVPIRSLQNNEQISLEEEWLAGPAGSYSARLHINTVPGEKFVDDNTNTITFDVVAG